MVKCLPSKVQHALRAWASKMAHQVKVAATNPKGLSSIPWTHLVEELTLASCPLISIHRLWPTCAQTNTNISDVMMMKIKLSVVVHVCDFSTYE